VKQGDHVGQGQLLAKLDDAFQRQQLASDQTQLAYAKDLYQRRKNLWDEKIGTEVDLVNAKNQVDQAEAKLKIDPGAAGLYQCIRRYSRHRQYPQR
jgi:membrane fusion protein (multidrug efflux system)